MCLADSAQVAVVAEQTTQLSVQDNGIAPAAKPKKEKAPKQPKPQKEKKPQGTAQQQKLI